MFQSEGERKIAAFLERYDIPYRYQPATLVNDRGYQRIWYPDFGLHKYSVFIEYFGMENDPVYDQRTRHKLDAYRKSDIAVVPVYPVTLKGNYEKTILKGIHQTVQNRVTDLEYKIKRFYPKPYQSNQRLPVSYSRRSKRY
jgi:hypothetical protein